MITAETSEFIAVGDTITTTRRVPAGDSGVSKGSVSALRNRVARYLQDEP